MINYMSNGKVMIIHLIVGLIKRFSIILSYLCKNTISSYVFKTLVALQRIKMSQYFPKPYQPFGGDINVKVDLNKLLVLQVLH